MATLKKTGALLCCSLILSTAIAQQQLTVDDCYALARENYPLTQQRGLIEKSRDYSLENAVKGYLPQLNIVGMATYQSDVVSLPIPDNLGIDIPALSKDQYKIYGEVSQTIYDGGNVRLQRKATKTAALVQEQSLEVNLYALRDRVGQLFFGILLFDRQLEQNALRKQDLENGLKTMRAAEDNGTALHSDADEVQVELLNAGQQEVELNAARNAYAEMLSLVIGRAVTDSVILLPSDKQAPSMQKANVNRPEMRLYDLQKQNLDVQKSQLNMLNTPKLSLFLQGGYGKPGLNMLSNDFEFYYIGGVRFSWNIPGLYTLGKEKKNIGLQQQMLDAQRETFVFNTELQVSQQHHEVQKLQELINNDSEIVQLRTSIKNTAKVQLDNGVMTSHDYIARVNAENQARQALAIHEINLMQTLYNYRTAIGEK
ncbi:MAG: TolC family protein [Prevotellaceae bacterium]|jgi:outer membrane protein TolC|nr:TolC family protein [Prevotellaceae bacterium]